MVEQSAALRDLPEIGDVLTSIRRLISDGGCESTAVAFDSDARTQVPRSRTEGRQAPPKNAAAQKGGGDDRLILSDGHRNDENLPQPAETSAELPSADQAGPLRPGGPDNLQALETGTVQTGTPVVATAVPPHVIADPTPANIKEPYVMLAEVSQTPNSKESDAALDDAFDLLSAAPIDEADQLAGGLALRNLVRDVIRQELQGDMGDRISRNLRRVARQEVTAAISTGLQQG